jgi:O-antigen biosynthesis protein
MTNQVLVITGMHRSGTSLMASLLQSAGLDVGQRLLMENDSNPKGHYEDLDFVNFHEDVLDAQGLHTAGWVLDRSIPISEILLPQAINLLEKNNSKPLWGWKDPRTVLFLDFWQKLIPEAKFIFVYRQPWEVMDSLFRRGNPTFVKNPNLALEVWQHYNQLILEFCQAFPDRSILLSLDSITQDPTLLIKAIQEKLGITLQVPESDRYDKSLLKRENSHHPLLVKTYFPEAIELYDQLCHHSLYPTASSTSLYLPVPPYTSSSSTSFTPSYKPWVAKDWVDYANMERHRNGLEIEVKKFHGQMIKAMTEAAQAHAEIAQAQNQAHVAINQAHAQAHAEVTKAHDIFQQTQAALQQQLDITHQELGQTKISHQHTQSHLLATQQELGKVQTELERLRGILRGMESSKFWLMRRVWMKFKRVLAIEKE